MVEWEACGAAGSRGAREKRQRLGRSARDEIRGADRLVVVDVPKSLGWYLDRCERAGSLDGIGPGDR